MRGEVCRFLTFAVIVFGQAVCYGICSGGLGVVVHCRRCWVLGACVFVRGVLAVLCVCMIYFMRAQAVWKPVG